MVSACERARARENVPDSVGMDMRVSLHVCARIRMPVCLCVAFIQPFARIGMYISGLTSFTFPTAAAAAAAAATRLWDVGTWGDTHKHKGTQAFERTRAHTQGHTHVHTDRLSLKG